MIRAACVLVLLATPAFAWEFTPGQPCLLTHANTAEDYAVELTYDPTAPLYSLSITRNRGFTPAPVFKMKFLFGSRPLEISTRNHVISADGKTLTVTDTGFGNVLDGMQFSGMVTAELVGQGTQDTAQTVIIPLFGAAGPVAQFRACDGLLPSA